MNITYIAETLEMILTDKYIDLNVNLNEKFQNEYKQTIEKSYFLINTTN